MNKRIYTPEMIEFIRHNAKNHPLSELTGLFNKHFNTNKCKRSIEYVCHKYRILKNIKFTKEMDLYISDNCKIYTLRKLTQEFNKKFSCDASVGTMRNKVRLLSGDYIKQDGKIISKARWLFTKYFGDNTSLGDDDIVIFKDGDKANYSKDNLMKVNKYDLSYLAGLGLYNIDKETTEAGLKIAQILRKLEEFKRHKKSN